MKVKISNTPEEFLVEYEKYLAADCKTEAINQLILHNVDTYIEQGRTADNIMGAVFDGNKVLLIFLNAKPYCLLCYQLIQNDEAIKELVKYLVENNIDISGINTTNSVNLIFRKYYQELTDKTFEKRLGMNIMYLDSLKEIKKAIGRVELVNYESMDLMAILFTEMSNEFFSEEHKTSDYYDNVKRHIASKDFFAFRNADNQLVSICSTGRTMRRGKAINGVFTLYMFRNCGYSTTLVYSVCEKMLNEGNKYCTLYVDQENPFANKVYHNVGFASICDSEEYILEKCSSK